MSDDLIKRSDVIEAFKGREPLIHDVYTATAIIRSVPSAERGLYMKFSTARKRMLKIIDELEKQCIDYYKAGEEAGRTKDIPSADRPQEWIPCSERLPEDIRPVLVTWKNTDPASYYQYIVGKHFIGTAHYCKGKWYWYSSVTEDLLAEYGKCESEEFDEAIEAVAWMPFPEPWEGE